MGEHESDIKLREVSAAELTHLCHSVTENSPLPIVAVEGITHLVRYANPAFCRLTQKSNEELVGKTFSEVVPEGDCRECLALLDRVFRTGTTETIADQEHNHLLAHPVYWSYVMWPVLDLEGRTTGVMIHVQDTTTTTLTRQSAELLSQEVRNVNQELLISGVREKELSEIAAERQQLLFQAQKLEGIGRLAGGIAHDFNNLLTAIMGFTELAEETLAPEDAAQDYLQNVQKAAERAATLTRQLLAFARKQAVTPQIVSVNLLIRDMDKMLRPLIGEHIALELHLQPDVGHIKIDSGQFGQVIMNLVVNARDAMPHGGKITIATELITLDAFMARFEEVHAAGDYVLLTVSDTGTGIDDKIRAHLFEPFFTTKEQGQGTGLGLATCYGIVKQNGGQIQVESAPETGTTFRIYLPSEAEAVSLVPMKEIVSPQQAGGVIFLVEDEAMVREIGAQTLRRQGYTVFEAENGDAALRMIAAYSGEIDLVVSDVVMPQMGGKEMVVWLRMMRPTVKVLFTSGYTDDAFVEQRLRDPGLAFLQKPFLPMELVEKVREVLDKE